MAFLLDTNIISELRKGRSDCNARVWSWYEATPLEEIYLSVLVLGEMRKGVEMKRKADPASAAALERWLREVARTHRARVLSISVEISEVWGRMTADSPLPVVDGLLAATARYYGLTVVTRNERDFQRCGVDYINPFAA